jgi:DNA-binding MarR family transcriptional regulator
MKLPRLFLKPFTVKVFLLLAPKDGEGTYPEDAAAILGVRRNKVDYHLKKLEDEGYIEKIGGKDSRSTPQFFMRTQKSPLLDEFAKALNLQKNTPKLRKHTESVSTPPEAPNSEFLNTPRSRTIG